MIAPWTDAHGWTYAPRRLVAMREAMHDVGIVVDQTDPSGVTIPWIWWSDGHSGKVWPGGDRCDHGRLQPVAWSDDLARRIIASHDAAGLT